MPSVKKNDKKNNPAQGLENNPAKDAHVFSDKHSYFPFSSSASNLNGSIFLNGLTLINVNILKIRQYI